MLVAIQYIVSFWCNVPRFIWFFYICFHLLLFWGVFLFVYASPLFWKVSIFLLLYSSNRYLSCVFFWLSEWRLKLQYLSWLYLRWGVEQIYLFLHFHFQLLKYSDNTSHFLSRHYAAVLMFHAIAYLCFTDEETEALEDCGTCPRLLCKLCWPRAPIESATSGAVFPPTVLSGLPNKFWSFRPKS